MVASVFVVAWYGRKTWHSTSKHRRHIWRCNNKYECSTACTTPHLSENQIRDAFTQAVTKLAPPPSREVLDAIITHTCDTANLEEQLDQAALARDTVLARVSQLVTTNASHAQDQDTYQHAFDQLQADYERHTKHYNDLQTRIRQAREKRQRIEQAHAYRTDHHNLDYSDDAWNALIDHATIYAQRTISIHFKDETVVAVQ